MSELYEVLGLEIHEVLGLTEAEYEIALVNARTVGGGVPVTQEPRWHSHPVLGITGHLHSSTEQARTPHTHRPEVDWSLKPVFFEREAQSDG